jgi:uncharacterized protein YjiK
MRELADIDTDDPLQPEGLVLLRNGHVLVAHEKEPRGLFELGPPDHRPLGVGAGSYLREGEAFDRQLLLAALAWWPVEDDRLDDISDLAVRDDRLFLLSDQSGCIARLAVDELRAGVEAKLDALWTLPDEFGKAEGLTFAVDGEIYVGLDVDIEKQPNERNLVRFPAIPPEPRRV